jgi:chlorophyllide a reductase subunit X
VTLNQIPHRCCLGARPVRQLLRPLHAKNLLVKKLRLAMSASSAVVFLPWSLAVLKLVVAVVVEVSFTDFDYVLLDFLGDVVCGGFGLPIARDMAQKVILVGSNDLQSLYVANNVCSAVEYFRKLGGNVGVAGLVINKDDGTGEAAAFAKAADIPVLASIPQDDDLRKKSANYQIVGTAAGPWGDLFGALAEEVAGAPPIRPKPLDQDGLLNLFDSKDTGGDVVLVPATDTDMRGKHAKPLKSLEVIYDEV